MRSESRRAQRLKRCNLAGESIDPGRMPQFGIGLAATKARAQISLEIRAIEIRKIWQVAHGGITVQSAA